MSAMILINTTTVVVAGASSKRFPGETVTDTALQTSIAQAGGQLVTPSAGITAAAAIATKLRSQGADESQLVSVMLAAYTAYVATLTAAETAAAISYSDGVSPAFGSTNVQGALDVVKADLSTIDSTLTTLEGDITTLNSEVAAVLPVQTGGGTLTNGASGNIPATITASSRITITRTVVNTSSALGELAVTNKTTGTPGHFVVDALTVTSPGTPLATDQSSFDWVVTG